MSKKTNNKLFCFIIVSLLILLSIITIVFFLKQCKCNGPPETTLPSCDSGCVRLSIINSDPTELFSAPVFRVYSDQIVPLDKQPRCFLTTNKGVRELFTAFSYAKTGLKGQIGLGFDQYALVFANPNPQYEQDLVTHTVELYLYTDINYWSFNWNNKQGVRIFITDKSNNDTCFKDWSYTYNNNVIPDPFTKGNNTIGCYLGWIPEPQPQTIFFDDRQNDYRIILGDDKFQNIDIFRIDQQTGGNLSKYGFLDGWRAEHCFNTYLFGAIFVPPFFDYREYKYGIIRIPVPNTYTGAYCPLSDDLDLNYFSVSTSYDPNLTPEKLKARMLPFWTVNGRMMKKLQTESKDSQTGAHLSYVIWMPVEDINELIKSLPSDYPTTLPPIVEFDQIADDGVTVIPVRAYVLGYSDYCWIFRYRTPSTVWDGNPDKADCVEKSVENHPIIPEQMKGWLPTILGSKATSSGEFLGLLKTQKLL